MPTFTFETETLGINTKIKTCDILGHEQTEEIKIEIVVFFNDACSNN